MTESSIGPVVAAPNYEQYYYDKEDDECFLCVYGGCDGSPNNFVSKEECEKECDVQPKVEIGSRFQKPPCKIPRRILTSCLAFIPRYYCDKVSDKCVFFVYGGCEVNSDNYETREDCEQNCLSEPKTHTELSKKQVRIRLYDV